jgi:MFS family permease
VQPFVGSLSDLCNSKYIVSISLLATSIGAFLCGLSRSFPLTCVFRLLVGLGCGCLYVPICRTFAQWFTVRQFPYAQSTILAFGGLGGLLGQLPLAHTRSNWPVAFYVGASVSFFLTFCALVVLQPSPDAGPSAARTCRATMGQLWANIKMSLGFRDFWCLALWKFLTPSTFQSVAATWGVAYLVNGLGYERPRAVYFVSATSIAWTVGAPVLAVASNWVRTRKWCLIVCTCVAAGTAAGFAAVARDPGWPAVLAMLIVFALAGGASLTVAAITFKEMLSKELVGTLMGCGNLVMIGTSVEQDITAAVVARYEDPDTGKVPLIAYRLGLWTLSAASIGLSLVLLLVIKDTFKKAEEEEKKEGPTAIEERLVRAESQASPSDFGVNIQ